MLAQRNEGYWAQLKKIDLVYLHRQWGERIPLPTDLADIGGIDFDRIDPQPYDDTFKYRWIFCNGCEILHKFSDISVAELPTGKATYHNCLRYDGRRATEEWVKDSGEYLVPTSLAESLANSCRMTILPTKNIDVNQWFPRASIFRVLFRSKQGGFFDRTLVQLLSSPGVNASKPIRSVNSQNDVLWTFRVDFDVFAHLKNDTEKHYLEIAVNESKGYILHQLIFFTPASLSNATDVKSGNKIERVTEQIVKKYQKIAGDIFFPEIIELGVGSLESLEKKDLGGNFYSETYTFSNVNVNGQVKENPCFTIPEFYEVARLDLLEDRVTYSSEFAPISIWGPNNEPIVTLETEDQYNEYIAAALSTPLTPAKFSPARIFCIVSGLMLIVFALYIRHREIRNKKSA